MFIGVSSAAYRSRAVAEAGGCLQMEVAQPTYCSRAVAEAGGYRTAVTKMAES